MNLGQRLRQQLNLLNLTTLCGLLLARAKRCELQSGPEGLILAWGYTGRLPIASAFTVGNVILFRGVDRARLAKRPELLAHESRHSTQYATCLGLPFLPLYFACCAWSLIRTGDPASHNFFERRAGLKDGGYLEKPVRRLISTKRNSLISKR